MPQKSKSKFWSNLLFVFVIVLSALFLLLALVPRLTGHTVCCVQSDSMAPAVKKGALVLAKPIELQAIQPGDLLVFADPESEECFTAQTAEVWLDQQQIVTQNADGQKDPYTTAYRCVQGKVFVQVPYVGYLPVFLNTVLGKVLAALLYIIWLALEIEVRSAEKRREKRA